MHNKITFLIAFILISVSSLPVQAGELNQGNDLVITPNASPNTETNTIQARIDELSKAHDDIKISDGVSAGIITEQENYTMENKERTPAREKGQEVGVGISLSF